MIHDLFGPMLSLGRSQNPQQLQHCVLQFFWRPVLGREFVKLGKLGDILRIF